jgi:tRNA (guanine6-N2)-methyltransferase
MASTGGTNAAARTELPKVYDYYATTAGGLEQVVLQDLRHHLRELRRVRVEPGRRHGRIFFHYERSPGRLLELRSVDNLFVLLGEHWGITTGGPALRQIAGQVAGVDLAPALALHHRLHGSASGDTLRLVCTVGGHHRFSAGQLFQAVHEVLGQHYRLADGTAETPCLQLQVLGRRALLGLQLTRRRLRDREYRQADHPGGLEATVAYCMALLAGVGRGDLCLDPMCGGGTTLIEAGLAFHPRFLVGGDLAPPALAAARQNAAAAGERLHLVRWQAGELPLADASVGAVLCNLPYGKKVRAIGHDEVPLLREMARVVRPGGRAVLLAGEGTAAVPFLEDAEGPFEIRQRLRLHLRGVSPFLYALRRRPAAGAIPT